MLILFLLDPQFLNRSLIVIRKLELEVFGAPGTGFLGFQVPQQEFLLEVQVVWNDYFRGRLKIEFDALLVLRRIGSLVRPPVGSAFLKNPLFLLVRFGYWLRIRKHWQVTVGAERAMIEGVVHGCIVVFLSYTHEMA